jgi:hypothetical protein
MIEVCAGTSRPRQCRTTMRIRETEEETGCSQQFKDHGNLACLRALQLKFYTYSLTEHQSGQQTQVYKRSRRRGKHRRMEMSYDLKFMR